jgi:hypothetical protein
MALGIARTAIETFSEIAGAKTPERTTQMLRNNHGAQIRISQAEALMRSARLFLFDTLERVWSPLIATGEVTMEARAHVRLAASHAVISGVQAVDLVYIGAGASASYTSCPLERAFRDVHAITQHIGVNPRVMETTGRFLFGLSRIRHCSDPLVARSRHYTGTCGTPVVSICEAGLSGGLPQEIWIIVFATGNFGLNQPLLYRPVLGDQKSTTGARAA